MDFSQLPKMSKTPAPPEQPPEESVPVRTPAAPPLDYGVTPVAGFGSAWISLIGGLICLLLGKTFASWLITRLRGETFDTHATWNIGPLAGQPVAYFDLTGGTAWTEMGLFLMGVALLLDTMLLFDSFRGRRPRRGLLWAAVIVTGVAVAVNVGLIAYLLSLGVTPLTSLIALLVGGMVLFDHVPTLRGGRQSSAAAVGER